MSYVDSLPPANSTPCNHTSPFRDDIWALPLLALSVLNMATIICFQFFVLCKICNSGAKSRNMFLGQMLLMGLFLASLTGVTFVVTPDWISCLLIRLGSGVSYALIFASLLVKSLFLMSLHDSYILPIIYQALLLFFAVAVQLAIEIQWLVQSPPDVINDEDGKKQCKTKPWQMLLSLLYIMFLILGVTILSVKIRGYKENYKEAKYIGGAIGVGIILWITWILVSILTNSRYFYVTMGYGVVCNATIMFFVMFLPKGRQLASMDHIERSSLNQSSYIPSLIPFYPPPSSSLSLVPPRKIKSVLKSPAVRNPPTYTSWKNELYRPDADRRYPLYHRTFNERYSNSNPNVRFCRTPVYIEDEWI
ncbi:metabotropic glutamate receptor 3-like [Centruroides vittatus]|uniref:metabotropic glutamate receptor 3-like n=1 Tax=Centruroides vittatus TaxID=120091 RepID=UPI00350ECF19